jgi:hypothetical protein
MIDEVETELQLYFLYEYLARDPFTERVYENREDSHWGALVVVEITFSLHYLCVLGLLY